MDSKPKTKDEGNVQKNNCEKSCCKLPSKFPRNPTGRRNNFRTHLECSFSNLRHDIGVSMPSFLDDAKHGSNGNATAMFRRSIVREICAFTKSPEFAHGKRYEEILTHVDSIGGAESSCYELNRKAPAKNSDLRNTKWVA